MKLNLVEFDKSSFATAEKDLFSIVWKLLKNEKLKKLLFYPVKNVDIMPKLTNDESLALIHKNIRVIPKLLVEEDVESYVIITFDNFITNPTNPEFRDNVITFDIICNLDTWVMDNYQLRPYKIMGEIDGMMNGEKLNGIGTVEFISASQIILNDTLAGYSLMYRVVNDV